MIHLIKNVRINEKLVSCWQGKWNNLITCYVLSEITSIKEKKVAIKLY